MYKCSFHVIQKPLVLNPVMVEYMPALKKNYRSKSLICEVLIAQAIWVYMASVLGHLFPDVKMV